MALFPKTIDFFVQFDRALENLSRAANLLVDTFTNFSTFENFEKKAKAIYEFEQEGDMLTHDIMKDLNKTFLTPIDREDIHALVKALDDVLDFMDAAANRFVLYKIPEPRPGLKQATELLVQSADAIRRAMGFLGDLKNGKAILEICVEINRLENEADSLNRISIGALFDTE